MKLEAQASIISPTTAGDVHRSIRRILVAIDGSESADRALNTAAKIAMKYSAEIDLIHVGNSTSRHSIRKRGRLSESAINSDKGILGERKQSLVASGLKTRSIYSHSGHGNIGENIVKVARTGKYDLVAVGSRGLGLARRFFLGSVSKKVVVDARCSVLVSKTRIDAINRILLAFDGSNGSRKALNFVGNLAKKFNAVVSVVSAISEPMLSSELDVRAAIEKLDNEMRFYSEQALSSLKEMGVRTEGAKVVGARKISIAITSEALKGSYDIIAIGNRGWGKAKSVILGSVASSILDSSKVSLLIVK